MKVKSEKAVCEIKCHLIVTRYLRICTGMLNGSRIRVDFSVLEQGSYKFMKGGTALSKGDHIYYLLY